MEEWGHRKRHISALYDNSLKQGSNSSHSHFIIMAAQEEYVLVLSYSKNFCIGVTAGSLTIGEVSLKRGQYVFGDNSFSIHLSQIYDFIWLIKKIGVHLANSEKHLETETEEIEQTKGERVLKEGGQGTNFVSRKLPPSATPWTSCSQRDKLLLNAANEASAGTRVA